MKASNGLNSHLDLIHFKNTLREFVKRHRDVLQSQFDLDVPSYNNLVKAVITIRVSITHIPKLESGKLIRKTVLVEVPKVERSFSEMALPNFEAGLFQIADLKYLSFGFK